MVSLTSVARARPGEEHGLIRIRNIHAFHDLLLLARVNIMSAI